MNFCRFFIVPQFSASLFVGVSFLIGCNGQDETNAVGRKTEDTHGYRDIFGDKYTCIGIFSEASSDSIETKLWFYSDLDRPLVFYGNYSHGMPAEGWKFGL